MITHCGKQSSHKLQNLCCGCFVSCRQDSDDIFYAISPLVFGRSPCNFSE